MAFLYKRVTWLGLALWSPLSSAAKTSNFLNSSVASSNSITTPPPYQTSTDVQLGMISNIKFQANLYSVFCRDMPSNVSTYCVSSLLNAYPTWARTKLSPTIRTGLWENNDPKEGATGTWSTTFVYDWRAPFPPISSPCCGTCKIANGNVRLLYWPKTGPSTLVSESYTYQSPTLYLLFNSAWASDNCGMIGTAMKSVTLPVIPSDLMGVYQIERNKKNWQDGVRFITHPSSFNLDKVMSECAIYGDYPVQTSTIDGDRVVYDPCHPRLAAPSEMRSLQPAWNNCVIDAQGVVDPPMALTATGALTMPAATPGQGGSDIQPVQTQDLSMKPPMALNARPKAESPPQLPSTTPLPASSKLESTSLAPIRSIEDPNDIPAWVRPTRIDYDSSSSPSTISNGGLNGQEMVPNDSPGPNGDPTSGTSSALQVPQDLSPDSGGNPVNAGQDRLNSDATTNLRQTPNIGDIIISMLSAGGPSIKPSQVVELITVRTTDAKGSVVTSAISTTHPIIGVTGNISSIESPKETGVGTIAIFEGRASSVSRVSLITLVICWALCL